MPQRRTPSLRVSPSSLSSKHLANTSGISVKNLINKEGRQRKSSYADLLYQAAKPKRSNKVPDLRIAAATNLKSLSPMHYQSRLEATESVAGPNIRARSVTRAGKASGSTNLHGVATPTFEELVSGGCISLLKTGVKSDTHLCRLMQRLTSQSRASGSQLTKQLEEFKGAVKASIKVSSHLQRSLSHEQSVGKYSLKTLVRAQNSMLLELNSNLETLDNEGEALSTKSSPEHDLRKEIGLVGALTSLRSELKQNLERLKYCEARLAKKERIDLLCSRSKHTPSRSRLRSLSPDKPKSKKLRPVKVKRQLPSVSFDSAQVPKLELPKDYCSGFHEEFMQRAPEFSESWRLLIQRQKL
jgi:hypothetical protein